MNLSIRMQAVFSLIFIGILGGIAPLLLKIALTEFNTIQILFIRFGVATLLVSPLLIKQLKLINLKKLALLIPAGLLFSANVFLFIVGIQFTTSIVSQLLYLVTPVFVSLISFFLFKENISFRRIISMFICFAGSSLLILQSVKDTNLIRSIGSIQGNILVIFAVISWSLYTVYAKRISKQFEPSQFLVTNFTITLLVSLLSFLFSKTSIINTIIQFGQSSYSVMASLLALAILNSVLFFFLHQWSLKRMSAFSVSSIAYISPLFTAGIAIPFFGEQLSSVLVISAVSIFLGSYLILTEKSKV